MAKIVEQKRARSGASPTLRNLKLPTIPRLGLYGGLLVYNCFSFSAFNSLWRFIVYYLSILVCWKKAGPGYSKLTRSLINVSLQFQTLISNIRQYFLLKKGEKLAKASLIFSTRIPVCLVTKS